MDVQFGPPDSKLTKVSLRPLSEFNQVHDV